VSNNLELILKIANTTSQRICLNIQNELKNIDYSPVIHKIEELPSKDWCEDDLDALFAPHIVLEKDKWWQI
jgi:hypothetical protein